MSEAPLFVFVCTLSDADIIQRRETKIILDVSGVNYENHIKERGLISSETRDL